MLVRFDPIQVDVEAKKHLEILQINYIEGRNFIEINFPEETRILFLSLDGVRFEPHFDIPGDERFSHRFILRGNHLLYTAMPVIRLLSLVPQQAK